MRRADGSPRRCGPAHRGKHERTIWFLDGSLSHQPHLWVAAGLWQIVPTRIFRPLKGTEEKGKGIGRSFSAGVNAWASEKGRRTTIRSRLRVEKSVMSSFHARRNDSPLLPLPDKCLHSLWDAPRGFDLSVLRYCLANTRPKPIIPIFELLHRTHVCLRLGERV